MEKKNSPLGYYIIGSAIIWGLTILGCAFKLKGTGCFPEISYILNGAAGVHLILIWCPLGAQLKKRNKDNKSGNNQKEQT